MAAPGDITLGPRMLIDGKLVEAESGHTLTNIVLTTEEMLVDVTDATKADLHRATDSAAGYFADVRFDGDKASGVEGQKRDAGFRQYFEVKSVAWPAG